VDREANPAGPFGAPDLDAARLESSTTRATCSAFGISGRDSTGQRARLQRYREVRLRELGVELPHVPRRLRQEWAIRSRRTRPRCSPENCWFSESRASVFRTSASTFGDGKMIHASSSSHHVVEAEVVEVPPRRRNCSGRASAHPRARLGDCRERFVADSAGALANQ